MCSFFTNSNSRHPRLFKRHSTALSQYFVVYCWYFRVDVQQRRWMILSKLPTEYDTKRLPYLPRCRPYSLVQRAFAVIPLQPLTRLPKLEAGCPSRTVVDISVTPVPGKTRYENERRAASSTTDKEPYFATSTGTPPAPKAAHV